MLSSSSTFTKASLCLFLFQSYRCLRSSHSVWAQLPLEAWPISLPVPIQCDPRPCEDHGVPKQVARGLLPVHHACTTCRTTPTSLHRLQGWRRPRLWWCGAVSLSAIRQAVSILVYCLLSSLLTSARLACGIHRSRDLLRQCCFLNDVSVWLSGNAVGDGAWFCDQAALVQC